MKLIPVEIGQLKPEHLDLLAEVSAVDKFGRNLSDFLSQISMRKILLHEVDDDVASGIVLLQILSWPKGNELYFLGWQGKRLVPRVRQIFDEAVRMYKDLYDCKYYGTEIHSPVWEKILERKLGNPELISKRYMKEL